MTQARKRLPATPRAAGRITADLDRRLDARLFKALSDPTRLVLLACLAKCARPCTVTEVAECCSVDFSVVSRHLAALAEADVLDVRKVGREVHYSVPHERLADRWRALADAFTACCGDAAGVSCCAGRTPSK